MIYRTTASYLKNCRSYLYERGTLLAAAHSHARPPACHFYHLSLKNPVKNCINTNQSHRQCDTWHLSTNGNYLSYKQSDAYLKRVAFLGCLWLITTVTAIQVCLYVFIWMNTYKDIYYAGWIKPNNLEFVIKSPHFVLI